MDKYIYFDTNILSELAKNPDWWEKLGDYLRIENYVLGVSGAQLVELSEATTLHDSLTELLWIMPSKAILTWDEIIHRRIEEGNLFGEIDIGIFPFQLSEMTDENAKKKFCQELLSADNMKEVRQIQLQDASKMRKIIMGRKSIFFPEKDGKYSTKQASKYAKAITRQWLTKTDHNLIKPYKDYGNRVDHFRAIEIYAYYVFYKYYIAGHSAKETSDFGDLFHVFYLPFVSITILEKGMAEILNQIKRNHNVLDNVEIMNIEFIRSEILNVNQ